MERKLASIQIVKEIKPIPGADMIEVVRINNWDVVSKKGEYKVGDFCIYCEIDSFLPIKEEFEFLRKTSYKKMSDGTEGFRLKTIRLRGQLSQGLLLPIHVLPLGELVSEGKDVTEMLGIVKYEHPIPAELNGIAKGLFPSFIRKTDEERIQNLSDKYEAIKKSGKDFYVTEKLDGTSATFYLKDGEFGICSRNLELLYSEGNTFWKVARELKLEEKLKSLGKNICIQGELLGPGVNGNIYKLNKHTLRIFNIYDIDLCKYYTLDVFINTIQNLKLQEIPILDSNFDLPKTIDELLFIADGKSKLNGNIDREGLVIRSVDRKISFKVISNKFLLKYE